MTRERDRLWHNSRDLLLVVDTSGTFCAVNPAWTSLLGYGTDELLGHSYLEFIHPDDHPSSRDILSEATQQPLSERYENRLRHRDGGYRWISWIAAPEGEFIYASGRHITLEREQAKALELSEARLRSVFETSFQHQGMLTTDGILIDANPISLSDIEAELKDVAGKPFWETPWFTSTPELSEQIRAGIEAVAAGEAFRQEIGIHLPKGQRAFDFSMRPVRDNAGNVIAIVPEAIDLTERRKAEEQLRQSQKMEAVGQLTGGIAHDFNNLLAAIIGCLDLTQRRLDAGRVNETGRYIAGAVTSAQRAAALTQRLLAFSRRQPLDPKHVNANRLLSGMEDLLRRTLGPEIDLEMVESGGLWPTLCDPNQLESAILNLAINARDAMPDGGKLTIETANAHLDDAYAKSQGSELKAGQYVAISVSDTGTGMTPDTIAKAFEPFFTTKPAGQGTGLGLSMLYGFIKQSDGHVRIYSEVGHGTTFKLYLPRQRDEAVSFEAKSEATPAIRTEGSETVLVVEDEPTVRMLITETLQGLGYKAIEASDGPTAVQILQSEVHIDLLITDVGLPGLNGRQIADAGRYTRPDLPVLFVTGYAHNAAIGQGEALTPGMEMLTKPFALDMLANKIRGMIERVNIHGK